MKRRGDFKVRMEPVSSSRIQHVHDGDVFSLGDDTRLKIILAPGHQPSGIVIYAENNKGLFINDLVGNYLADADFHYSLNPFGSDNLQIVETLKEQAKSKAIDDFIDKMKSKTKIEEK